jgi:hypothetical protein
MKSVVRRRLGWLTLIPFLMVVGCSSDDQRLANLSRQSLDRQAEQNRLIATNNQQVIDATKKLVEADAQSRHENSQLQHEFQSERSGIDQQRDALEEERREIASQRNRDPIVAESIKTAAGLIVAALPLIVCLFLLRGLFQKSDDEAVADVLTVASNSREQVARARAGIKSISPFDGRDPSERKKPRSPRTERESRGQTAANCYRSIILICQEIGFFLGMENRSGMSRRAQRRTPCIEG